jgi:hypothetical protein
MPETQVLEMRAEKWTAMIKDLGQPHQVNVSARNWMM